MRFVPIFRGGEKTAISPFSLAGYPMIRFAITLSASLIFSGCATISTPHNVHSRIAVTTSCGQITNVGARCVLVGGGQQVVFDTPADLRVPNSWSLLTVDCQGEMLGSASTVIIPKPNLGLVGNLLVGGAPGAVVDVATGRGLNYDRSVNLHRNQCFR